MKHDTGKSKKHAAAVKVKPVCGTLSYLAECRGMAQKAGPTRLSAPPGDVNKIIRKYPAA
ncbi:MAG: hypothetical protein ACM3MD_10605 [Betaproteobacteria bacterium]